MIRKTISGCVVGVFALLMASAPVLATSVVVKAYENSSNAGTGTGASTGLTRNVGDLFEVSVAASDLWNAGPLKRWSNADGLQVNLYATGVDESGYAAGTHIGEPFSQYNNSGLTTYYGTLVGRFEGSTLGAFFEIGTYFSGAANATGELKLFYWDSNNYDNTEQITANVSAVPLPAPLMLLGSALAALGVLRRRTAA